MDDVEHLRDLASEAPVIRLVNLIIQRAVEMRASDIHIEPFENRLKVRYRIDGVLADGESPPTNLTAAVISRSEQHTSELPSLMRNSYAVYCLKTKRQTGKEQDRTQATNAHT